MLNVCSRSFCVGVVKMRMDLVMTLLQKKFEFSERKTKECYDGNIFFLIQGKI